MSVAYEILYQQMRGRIMNKKSTIEAWQKTVKDMEATLPNLSRDDFDFPAQCLAIFLEHYTRKYNEEIVALKAPFKLALHSDASIVGDFHLLSKTPYGTRITVFDCQRTDPPDSLLINDIFMTAYSIGYRWEFEGRKELNITYHNLGTGKYLELIKKDGQITSARQALAQNLELWYNKYAVPNEGYCKHCPIATACHIKRYTDDQEGRSDRSI